MTSGDPGRLSRMRVPTRLCALALLLAGVAQGMDRGQRDLGDRHLARGEFEQARLAWARAWADEPDAPDHALRAGSSYALEGAYAEAERIFSSAGEKHPQDWRIAYHQGLLAVKRGDDATAERVLLELTAGAPWYPGAHYALGALYERQGDLERAKRMYTLELNANSFHSKALQRLSQLSAARAPAPAPRVAWWIGGGCLALALGLMLVYHRAARNNIVSVSRETGTDGVFRAHDQKGRRDARATLDDEKGRRDACATLDDEKGRRDACATLHEDHP